jgi:drug/metabolite transporter (DMT)-like permease
VGRLAAATLLVAGTLLGLIGLFFIAYSGDSGDGDTYIRFGDDKIDADIVGSLVLIVALLLVVAAIALLRRLPSRG